MSPDGPDESALYQMLGACGEAACSILREQIVTVIAASDGVFAAYAQMPVPLVCWWLGRQVADLLMFEREIMFAHRDDYAPNPDRRRLTASNINATIIFLRESATLNSRIQPGLAEQAYVTVDAFTDDLHGRVRYGPLNGEDLTYGELIPAPTGKYIYGSAWDVR